MKTQAECGQPTGCRRIPARFLFASLFALLLCAPVSLWGQATGGRVRGTVSDPSGAVIPAIKVSLASEATRATRDTQTNSNGDYAFLEVPVGTYTIESGATGFKKYVRKGITVELNQVVQIDIVLQVGTANEVVEVTAAPPLVDTTTTQLGAVVNERAVTNLPLASRDTYQLLQLQPGVQSPVGSDAFYGSDRAGVVSVNGGRGRDNNFSVNGGDGNDLFANLPVVQPSPDSIAEFRVLTNTFDAEYGRNSGAVVNVVTKSGTNNFHGNLYEFFRNQALNARGFFDTTKPDYLQNQFGATFGGPIRPDRTFFFVSYEGSRVRRGTPSDTVTLPTDAERMGEFSSGPIFAGTLTNPTVAALLAGRPGCQAAIDAQHGGSFPITANTSYGATRDSRGNILTAGLFTDTVRNRDNIIPVACFDATALDLLNQFVPRSSTGSFQSVPLGHQRDNQFTLKMDHEITKNQHLTGYYYFTNEFLAKPFARFQAGGANLPGFGDLTDQRIQQVNISHNWAINANTVNEARFTFFREGQGTFLHPQRTNPVTASCTSAARAFCFTGTNNGPLVDGNGNPISPNPKLGITPSLGAGREGVPFISISGGPTFGNNFEGELPQTGNTFQWSDGFSKVIGRHALKFGGDLRYQRFDQELFFDINGEFLFTGGGPNDVGGANLFPNYLLGLPESYLQGSAQQELIRSKSVYLFTQDSWSIRPNVTLNYGLRWELNTPLADAGLKVQTFRPGQNTTIYPCQLAPGNPLIATFGTNNCNPGSPGASVFPTGLVVPGDKGIPNGLTQTYYKAFAPRIGLAWSPGWKDGWLSKLTGGPGKTSVRMGWGMFYNPVEQLVLEQFSAEPPFGGSTSLFNVLFSTPFLGQNGIVSPNPFNGILNPPRGRPVDWSVFRPVVLFGQLQAHERTQYAAQYNLTMQREIARNVVLQIGYVGRQGHRLLATHDLNFGIAQTCLDLQRLSSTANPAYTDPAQIFGPLTCQSFSTENAYGFVLQPGDRLTLPNGRVITGAAGGTPIGLVGLRPFSSPNCDPLNGWNPSTVSFSNGCPPDGVPIFGSIFAQDNIANSSYHALQVMVEKRFSAGLQFQAAYTFGKSLDNASSFENLLNPLNSRANRSLSLFDARHRFVFSYYWELPIPKKQGFTSKVLNGWALSGITTFQSGFPIRITSQSDLELQNSFDFETPGEPNLVGTFRSLDPRQSVCALGTGPNAGRNTPPTGPVPCVPIAGGFDPNIFTNATVRLGTIGNAPRSICCSKGINNFEIGILKATPLTERTRLEFRAELFNVFNHAQFFVPDGNITNGNDFGRVKRARDPRLVQFALKLFF